MEVYKQRSETTEIANGSGILLKLRLNVTMVVICCYLESFGILHEKLFFL